MKISSFVDNPNKRYHTVQVRYEIGCTVNLRNDVAKFEKSRVGTLSDNRYYAIVHIFHASLIIHSRSGDNTVTTSITTGSVLFFTILCIYRNHIFYGQMVIYFRLLGIDGFKSCVMTYWIEQN